MLASIPLIHPVYRCCSLMDRQNRAFCQFSQIFIRDDGSNLNEWVDEGASPMCGNSICQDRRFLAREMPALERFFHYRNLDVSTLKILASLWAPTVAAGFRKESEHLALSDIRDSIDELTWYRENLLDSTAIGISWQSYLIKILQIVSRFISQAKNKI